MNDCYRVLGVDRHASPEQIRAAFLARMKVCHPDAGHSDLTGQAAEISQAYWQLRDPQRRDEHDQLLFGQPLPTQPRRPTAPRRKATKAGLAPLQGRPAAPPSARATASSRRRPPRGRRLEPLRAAAGIASCALAIAGFALAGTYFNPDATSKAQAATPAQVSAARTTPPVRRRIDAALAEAAADEFRTVVAESGLAGANLYARQCLVELTARPTLSMLDYCLAFDDEASAWEKAPAAKQEDGRRYFATDQRFSRYATAAREIAPGPVRESMMADVSFFAQVRD